MVPKQALSTLGTHLFFIVLFWSSVFPFQHVCNRHDQYALLAFSASISTSPSLPLNWSSHITCCQWEGVECDINGRVTHLHLPSKGLKGVIPSSITNLVMLKHLNLSNNYLHGPLRNQIIRLRNLRTIDLSTNSILGFIPRVIGKLLYLEKLHLNQNNFSGPIPASLMNCTHLLEILFRDNNLSGNISKLDFSKLVLLQKLDFLNNSLYGTLPESIYSCKSLIAIRVAHNLITGQISPKIVHLKSLSFLSLAENSLTNITLTLRVLAKCKNLTFLSLSSNFYGESLPVKRNFISLGDYPKLQFFMLRSCKFKVGPIPNWLLNLKSLRVISMGGGNRFIGKVPKWLGTLPKLFTLGLSDNSLCGEVPLKVWQLQALITENASTDLKYSPFELPIYFPYGNMQSIRFKGNYYRGIFLSNNSLHGIIPKQIGGLQNMQQLFLSGNHFSGQIPTSISNLKNLEKLDLSTNNLTGEIPTTLSSLSFLSYFNVSYNNLQGPIPTGAQFGSFGESNFEGNPKLCGEPLSRPCSLNPATLKPVDKNESLAHTMQIFIDGLLVGFAFGFSTILVVVASFFWFNYYKKFRPSPRRG